MRYKIDVTWAGCDVSDILAEVFSDSQQAADNLLNVMKLADGQTDTSGFRPRLGLRVTDMETGKQMFADRDSDWVLR